MGRRSSRWKRSALVALRSCPVNGCGDANQLIVEHTKNLRYPTALALDDATVWVAVRGDPDADAGGWIVRLPKGP